ncbi:UDP-galactopyranose mutase [Thermophilibacter sp.]
MLRTYDVLIVGSGLFGSIVAREAADRGLKPLVLERRSHIGGNCWSWREGGIDVHAYGPHVVFTNDRMVWNYLRRFCEFLPHVCSPIANYRGELYSLPFNMNTFYALWGVTTPDEAKRVLEEQRIPCPDPKNLEERALDLAGRDVYEKLVRGYSEKQYGRPCTELPPSLISRMPMLLTFDNDYLHTRYQGVPEDGYGALFKRMLDGIEVKLDVDFLHDADYYRALAPLLVFTGPIDEFYGYRFGSLEYRGRRFEHEHMDVANFQGCAIMNYTDAETPYLRVVEHKHFTHYSSDKTVVTREYSAPWQPGDEPYYTVGTKRNLDLYARYAALASADSTVRFGGRLGEYRYFTMADTVTSALRMASDLFGAGEGGTKRKE